MKMLPITRRLALGTLLASGLLGPAFAQSGNPVRIGFITTLSTRPAISARTSATASSSR